ncbi:protein DBF4 homolog B [Bufo gargarizans]|uniref:protein DBF4 homolog B n=1 Tax=Bufo gargarizans TaxID=30331 RepID=UPI001CF51333|nr:protein DBF4 homolog B [Bufo gargarizans]XP_044154146.1 protein DBF4 homolog B [Bufo gargarizans]
MAALSPVPSGRHPEKSLTLDRRKIITFTGKLFYLDLPHNKQTRLLTKAISSLGGVIESFLSKDVNYMVTGSRKPADVANGESRDRKGGIAQNPAAEKIEKTPFSRGKQLLKKVVQTQECSSILSSARSWGVCVLHVDEVLKYLEYSTQRQADRPTDGKGAGGAGKKLKVGKLKSPFLKIEDQSRKYRPIHCSFSNFPECSFISSDRSPFETARTNNSTHKDRDLGEQDKDDGERPQNWEKSGYCECCQMTYTKLSEHLISEQHCLFALNASNYRLIDDITSDIVCDFVPLPHGFKPREEQSDNGAPAQSVEEPALTEDKCLLKEEHRQVESKEQSVAHSLELPTEEHNLDLPEKQHVKQDSTCSMVMDSPLSRDLPVENTVINAEQEYNGGLPENLVVEEDGLQCTLSTTNALVQCDLPLAEAGEASHVGLVTEVSWYTEEAGLTSMYSVQSLVIPPAHVLDQHPELAMENTSVQPLFLNALGDSLHALAQGGFNGSSNEPVLGDPIISAHLEPLIISAAPHQTNQLLVDDVMPSAGGPACESECTVHHLDPVTGAEVPLVEPAVDHRQHVMLVSTQKKLLVNAAHEVQTELSNNLSIDQLTLAPWHPGTEGDVTVTQSTEPLGNLVDSQETEPMVSTTDWCVGKRKHCLSPCQPPAKRQPLHCQSMPMWVFHQLPGSMNQPTVPVFSDWADRDRSNRTTEGEGTALTLCFNPKLAQYENSSESDWDSQLVSQRHSNPQQTAHFGELRTAQVNLDESLYGKQLCSVLAHEQTLGSPGTTPTVTLSRTSYDIYLSGVAS